MLGLDDDEVVARPRQRRLRLSRPVPTFARARMEIKDRVAIVTGGGGGIGSAVARHWMADGARAVVVADRNGDAAQAVGDEIGCLGVELDVTDEAAIVALVERVEHEIGPIDIFFSNAGAGGAAAASRRRTRRGRRSGSCT